MNFQSLKIDHYTIIVPDAKAVCQFHIQALGFKYLRLQMINAGSAKPGKYDMLNYILTWPNDPDRVLVITEGLTQESIFQRYLNQYGQGIHHIAIQVDDIEKAFEDMQKQHIQLTSDELIRDPLTGLKQCFIDRSYLGVFVELIERGNSVFQSEAQKPGFFTKDNMSGLAVTMHDYLRDKRLKDHADSLNSSQELIQETSLKNYEDFHITETDYLKLSTLRCFYIFSKALNNSVEFAKNILGFQKLVQENQSKREVILTLTKDPEHYLVLQEDQEASLKPSLSRVFAETNDPKEVQKQLQAHNIDFTPVDMKQSAFGLESALALNEKAVGYPFYLMKNSVTQESKRHG
ncbi:MAG: VOC family protein [Deltaproteobacteria bacterium]|nr:VOC family protein [Deltaproteobacteria bacterium]